MTCKLKAMLGTIWKGLGQLGWANFVTSTDLLTRQSYLQILKMDLQILANHYLSFDTYFKVWDNFGGLTSKL